MKNHFFLMSTLLLAGLMTSCSSTGRLEPRAQNIKVMTGSAPKSCQFRGNVGISESGIYGPSHKSKQEEQINIMRNQAIKLGANVIYITNHKTKYYPHPEYIIAEGRMQWELDAHAMSGKAYRCNNQIINQRNQKTHLISDVRPMDE